MRRIDVVLVVVLLAAAVAAQEPPSTSAFARWEILDPEARVMRYLGRESLFLAEGVAWLPEAAFADGAIEFDVALHGQPGFAGVAFRGQSATDYELIYLRTHRSREWDALQYTPIFGLQEAWQLYVGPGYNGSAELPRNRWLHVEVAIAGRSARVRLDGADAPQLTVTDLKRPWASGRVGLWGRFGAAHFSNVRVTAASPVPVSAPAAPAIGPLPGVLTRWALSPTDKAPAEPLERLPAVASWEAVEAEPSGILNLARFRRPAPGPRDRPDRVLARTVLHSASARAVRLEFGYSDAVTIFLNGAPIFSGRNGYLERDGSALGSMTLGPDALHLGLRAGANELVFAVSERFGGWGLAARLLDASGVTAE